MSVNGFVSCALLGAPHRRVSSSPISRGSGSKPGFVTQRASSIRARADRAAPGDYAVSVRTGVLQHLLRGGRVKRPFTKPCVQRA